MRPTPLSLIVLGLAAATVAVVLAPLAVTSPEALATVLVELRFRRALLLSLGTACASATIATLLAIPVAYYVSRTGGALARLASSLHLLFLGLPPVGLGITLMILLRYYPGISRLADELGLVFTVKAIIVAQTAVITPLSVSLLTNVFSYIPRSLEELASVYGARGARRFYYVILPLAYPGIAGAWVLAFFRALGEFGATLVLAGNNPGYTETLPIAMYNMISLARVEEAAALLVITVALGVVAVTVYTVMQSRLASRIEGLSGRIGA